MPHMPDIFGDVVRDWDEFRAHHHHPQTPAPGPVTLAAAPPEENPVSLFTEAKTILHDGLEKLEAVDEGAQGVVEAIKVNPTAVSITNTLASIAHLPDPQGLLASADALLKSFGAILSQGAQSTALSAPDAQPAADPSLTPAGPSVAGQA
jgi:hypothetical protein